MRFFSSDGQAVDLEVLATSIHPTTGRKYAFYTDFDLCDGCSKVYASELVKEDSNTYRLGEINTEEEWSYLQEVFDALVEETNQREED